MFSKNWNKEPKKNLYILMIFFIQKKLKKLGLRKTGSKNIS